MTTITQTPIISASDPPTPPATTPVRSLVSTKKYIMEFEEKKTTLKCLDLRAMSDVIQSYEKCFK